MRRISTSRSMYCRSSDARSSESILLNSRSWIGAYSNQFRKSKGSFSERSRQWWSLRATAGKYLSPIKMCCDCSSKTLRRSSCVSSHQAAFFRSGINAAQVASGRAKPCCFATISLFSSRMTYRSLLVIPRSIQGALVSGCNSEADITLSPLASGSDVPTMVSVPTIRHRPLSPPIPAGF